MARTTFLFDSLSQANEFVNRTEASADHGMTLLETNYSASPFGVVYEDPNNDVEETFDYSEMADISVIGYKDSLDPERRIAMSDGRTRPTIAKIIEASGGCDPGDEDDFHTRPPRFGNVKDQIVLPVNLAASTASAPEYVFYADTKDGCETGLAIDPATGEGYQSVTKHEAGGYNWGSVSPEYLAGLDKIGETQARVRFPVLFERIDIDAGRATPSEMAAKIHDLRYHTQGYVGGVEVAALATDDELLRLVVISDENVSCRNQANDWRKRADRLTAAAAKHQRMFDALCAEITARGKTAPVPDPS